MNKKINQIGSALFCDDKVVSYPAQVVSVNEQRSTCVVDSDGYLIYDVRLRASIDDNTSKLVLIPAVGSYVIVSELLDGNDCYVSMFSEVDKLISKINGKYSLSNYSISLKSVLNDFLETIKNSIVQTPAGAGTLSPQTISKLEIINNKINQLLDE